MRRLQDRRTGRLFGWNHEMAKIPYMKEVDDESDDFVPDKPDPTYVDPTTGDLFVAEEVVVDQDTVLQLGNAFAEGQAALTDDPTTVVGLDEEEVQISDVPVLVDGEPPWAVDTGGNRLYDEDGQPLVYVLDADGELTYEKDGTPQLELYVEPKPPKKSSKK